MNPSKRHERNCHVTPECERCQWEEMDDPSERPCSECIRSELVKKGEVRGKVKFKKDYFKFRVYGGVLNEATYSC